MLKSFFQWNETLKSMISFNLEKCYHKIFGMDCLLYIISQQMLASARHKYKALETALSTNLMTWNFHTKKYY